MFNYQLFFKYSVVKKMISIGVKFMYIKEYFVNCKIIYVYVVFFYVSKLYNVY